LSRINFEVQYLSQGVMQILTDLASIVSREKAGLSNGTALEKIDGC